MPLAPPLTTEAVGVLSGSGSPESTGSPASISRVLGGKGVRIPPSTQSAPPRGAGDPRVVWGMVLDINAVTSFVSGNSEGWGGGWGYGGRNQVSFFMGLRQSLKDYR